MLLVNLGTLCPALPHICSLDAHSNALQSECANLGGSDTPHRTLTGLESAEFRVLSEDSGLHALTTDRHLTEGHYGPRVGKIKPLLRLQPSDLKHIAGTPCNVMLPEERGYRPTGSKARRNTWL